MYLIQQLAILVITSASLDLVDWNLVEDMYVINLRIFHRRSFQQRLAYRLFSKKPGCFLRFS
jgi:hypothetical protein